MSIFTAFHAIYALHRLVSASHPLFQTSLCLVTYVATFCTLDNVDLRACSRIMTSLVTLEADLFCALKAVVRVLPTENTRGLLRVIWAVLGLVTDLFAVVTLNCWIVLRPVALTFKLPQGIEHVISVVLFLLHLFKACIMRVGRRCQLVVLFVRRLASDSVDSNVDIVFIAGANWLIQGGLTISSCFVLNSAEVIVAAYELGTAI